MFEALVYNSYEQYIKFIKFNLFRRKAYYLVAPSLIPLAGAAILHANGGSVSAVYLFIAALMLPFFVFMFNLRAAKSRYGKNRDYSKSSTFFQFNQDYAVLINYTGSKKNILRLEYKEIYMVYENRECFYLYLTESFAHYIPKKDMSKGSPEGLSELLKGELGKKFKG